MHSVNCTNVQNLMYEVERKIDVEWRAGEAETFPVKLLVHTEDRPGILNQLTSVLFAEQTNIRSLEARSDDERAADGAIIDMTVEIKRQEATGARGQRTAPHLRRSGYRESESVLSNSQTISAEPEHIAISKSKGIKIDWRDRHHSEYSLAYLRDECPCASCTGAHGTEPQKSSYAASSSSAKDPFPMYKPICGC